MSIEQTAEEFAESLNGFEEIAIRKQFGHEIDDLPGSMGGRAMVFTHLVRTGKPAEEAYKGCMLLGLKEVDAYFAEDDEITPDAPETESGKDDSPSDAEPRD